MLTLNPSRPPLDGETIRGRGKLRGTVAVTDTATVVKAPVASRAHADGVAWRPMLRVAGRPSRSALLALLAPAWVVANDLADRHRSVRLDVAADGTATVLVDTYTRDWRSRVQTRVVGPVPTVSVAALRAVTAT